MIRNNNKKKRFLPYTRKTKKQLPNLPNEIIEIIFEWLICIHIIEPIINTHYLNITLSHHPKRIFDKLRLINKTTKKLCEFLFIEWLSNEFKVFDNEPEILHFYFKYIYKSNDDEFSIILNLIESLNIKVFELILSEYNFWKIMLLNVCIRPNANHLTNLIVNFGCFKFFNIYPETPIRSIRCYCNRRLYLVKSRDGKYWYLSCKRCNFYEVIASYVEQHKFIKY